LVEWVLGSARTQPLVSVIEDLHWVDPSTLELIQLLVEQGAASRLLLLYTARPEFHPLWPLRAHHAQLVLNRLSARNVRTMVGEVAALKALSDETIATVVERTGGVPLFVEELTRAVLESGDSGLTGRAIPATLHDSLMARLDRLGAAKEVIQIGAVLGSDFSYALLHAAHPIAEGDLQRALRSLTDAELLYVRGIAPEANYQFKHALIRDAAYEALLKSRRKELHLSVARAIDGKFPVVKETHPEVLARHWTEAGEADPAVTEWHRAGERAVERRAYREAEQHYRDAIALLKTLPESPKRDSREFELRGSVVLMLILERGHAAPETIEAIERTAVLAEKSGNLTQLFGLLIRRAFSAYFSGDLPAAGALADQALDLARREGTATSLAMVHFLQIATRHFRGDLAGTEKHFIEGFKFFDDPGFTQNPAAAAVSAFATASWNAWTLGRADVARERITQMMARANGDNPFHVATSHYYIAYLRIYTREYERAEAFAARALELCEKHQFLQFAGYSRCILGHARAQLGRTSEGIGLIHQGIAGLRQAGTGSGIGRFIAFLAAAQEREGAITDALETIEQALRANPGELVYRPEIFRLRGQLRLKQGQTDQADLDFREAIALARSMGAKSFELRATMSLARLLRDTSRREEARAMLAEIYSWFTEGFDTLDLKEAKTLLNELNR
jgi:predicted ATPase